MDIKEYNKILENENKEISAYKLKIEKCQARKKAALAEYVKNAPIKVGDKIEVQFWGLGKHNKGSMAVVESLEVNQRGKWKVKGVRYLDTKTGEVNDFTSEPNYTRIVKEGIVYKKGWQVMP